MKYKGYVVIGVRMPVEVEGGDPEKAVEAARARYLDPFDDEPVPVKVDLGAGDGEVIAVPTETSTFLTDEQGNEYTDDRIRVLQAKLEAEREGRSRAEQLLMTIIHSRPGRCVTLDEKSFTDLPDYPRLHQQNNKDGSFILRVVNQPPMDPAKLIQ